MVTIVETAFVRAFCCIRLDNGTRWWIRREDLPLSGFQEGLSFEEEAFYQQVRLCQYPRALNQAVSLLAARPCSRGEIEQNLLRHRYTDEVVDLVLYKLEKEKLLNDREFSDLFNEDLYAAIDLRTCMEKRGSEGGTSVASVEKQIAAARKILTGKPETGRAVI